MAMNLQNSQRLLTAKTSLVQITKRGQKPFHGARPKISVPYTPKLRLLVTSSCTHRCPFCHNEGQSRQAGKSLTSKCLQPHLPILRNFSNRITISGGEPLQAPDIDRIVEMLAEWNFDITLVTAGAELDQHRKLLRHLSSLHVSIISLNVTDSLASCNGPFEKKVTQLQQIRGDHPELQLCLNIPFVEPRQQILQLPRYLELARLLSAKLKFVGEFKPRASALEESTWIDRWSGLCDELALNDFRLSDSGAREVEYLDRFGLTVELSEVACLSVDAQYGSGRCFDNMDVTVDSELRVTLCRWQNNGVSLNDERTQGTLPSFLQGIVASDTVGCPYNIGRHPLSEFSNGRFGKYIFEQHYDWPASCPEADRNVSQLITRRESSYYGRNGVVARFEREFAEYHNIEYCLTTCSGTAALYLSYLALGFGRGAEVIVPVYSYPGTVTPLLLLGAKIRFCDVSPLTGNICPDSLKKAITPSTVGVVVTHMWGDPIDLDAVMAVCSEYGLKLVEDCSHAIGATFRGKRVGTFGDVGCFSLQANKLVCAGEGGVLITRHREIMGEVVVRSSIKSRILDAEIGHEAKKYWETGLGLKLKIHPFGAAVALGYLESIERFHKLRRQNVDKMNEQLIDIPGVSIPIQGSRESKRVYYTYKPLLDLSLLGSRDLIIQALILSGLRISRSDLRPLSSTELFRECQNNGDNNGELEPTEPTNHQYSGALTYFSRIISFPAFVTEPEGLIRFYMKTFNEVMQSYAK